MDVDREIDRILTLLRNKIRERGFTQLEVQESLGWGRSYISQLLTRQKSLRVEQVLLVLKVIGVDPSEFYAELYHLVDRGSEATYSAAQLSVGGSRGVVRTDMVAEDVASREGTGHAHLKSMLHGLVQVLLDKNLVSADELSDAVRESEE